MIRLENIVKTFNSGGKSFNAVDDVSLTIGDGEIYGIIGFSGAGKSTIVRCINLLERPTSGKVFLGDTELTALPEKELREQRRRMGMIFQQFNLFASRTVIQNVMFPLKHSKMTKAEKISRAKELLELVGLSDKEKSYPSQLSGGQKQRAAIARALACNPEILLCDEATSALDPQTTDQILKLLKELNERLGITIVMITHQMNVVKEICTRAAVMEEGKVVEEGDVFTLFANPKQPVTRAFVEMTSNLSRINTLIDEKSPIVDLKKGQYILRFKYLERSACDALVSQLSREYNINLNIIFGNIDIVGGNPIGGLVVIADGKTEDIRAAVDYLCRINVGVEVLLSA
jgi:D-methionine transport system ATP-binding protein